MRTGRYVLALALLLVPAAATAQQGAAPAQPAIGPIERLVQHKTDLALTPDQVQKLEAIRQRSAERERELVGKITEARGVPPGVPLRTRLTTEERQAFQARRQAAQPYMNQLRELHQQQIQEARGILTAQQNARAWGRGQCCGDGPGMMRGPGGPGRAGMRGGRMGPRGW